MQQVRHAHKVGLQEAFQLTIESISRYICVFDVPLSEFGATNSSRMLFAAPLPPNKKI